MNITEEMRKQIAEDYANRENGTVYLSKKWKMTAANILKIAEAEGVEPRMKKKRVTTNSSKTCKKCHKAIEVKGARFCPYCGTDIRSESELLIEKLEKVIGLTVLLSDNDAEEARKIIGEAITFIKAKK